MTDKEKLIELLDSFGCGMEDKGKSVKIQESFHEKVVGYSFFYAEFCFDDSGKFINVGIYE